MEEMFCLRAFGMHRPKGKRAITFDKFRFHDKKGRESGLTQNWVAAIS